MCGTAPWEWDPEQGGSRHAYDAEDQLCHGCYVTQSFSERNDGEKSMPGTTVGLVPNTAERRERVRLAHLRTMESRRREREQEAEQDRLEAQEAAGG